MRSDQAGNEYSPLASVYRRPTVMGLLSRCALIGIPASALALQLHFSLEMSAACFGLVGAPPERPCDDIGGLDASLCELHGDAADFLNRPADQERCFVRRPSIVFLGGGVTLAR